MDTSKLKNASKQQKMIGCCGCLAVVLVLFVIFWIIGTVAGPSEPEKPEKEATTATATTQAPATEKAKPTKEAKPTEKPKPSEKPKPTETPKPAEKVKPTEAPTKAAKKSKCEAASPEVLETISGGLHDGRVLKEGWIVKSDINDLWYVSAPIPDSSLTGVWIITRPDGTGLTVSANSATAMYSNWPDGTKSPKFEPVSGEGVDIVQKALACQP
ncbi:MULTISPECIES: hypothetical protein [Dermabacter]|uniref:hypothetical protein n=1 Tax=Dermabacter sp. TaxID=37640 RepID=UPI0029032DA0|nr:hypothetical protein [Dermabacter sp.]MDU1463946.1 hypothetical protein [Dermabacter sp.]MDU4692677.1 hypothetical protein [Dermabacter sp.]